MIFNGGTEVFAYSIYRRKEIIILISICKFHQNGIILFGFIKNLKISACTRVIRQIYCIWIIATSENPFLHVSLYDVMNLLCGRGKTILLHAWWILKYYEVSTKPKRFYGKICLSKCNKLKTKTTKINMA